MAVVGVTGTIGGRVAGKLVEAGHRVVGLARSSGEGPVGVHRVAVDLSDRSAAVRALEGVDGVYLTPPLAGEAPVEQETAVTTSVIDAARELGIDHVVMHSAVHADRGSTGARILDNKHPIEEALAGSGVGYTILRPAWYLQNLFGAKAYLEQGVFSMPWPADMVWAATDVDDVAVAAAAFLEKGSANRGFDVHLPGGVTGSEICEAVERVTGKPVAYHEAPGTREAVDPYPISEIHKELYAELFDYFKATEYLGDPEPITEAVDGFGYGTVEDFVRRELFAGVEA
jgi:NAD(P)H dehydrogenase (quinone)